METGLNAMHFRFPGFRRLQLLTKGGAPVAFVEFQVRQLTYFVLEMITYVS